MNALHGFVRGILLLSFLVASGMQAYAQSGGAQANLSFVVPFTGSADSSAFSSPQKLVARAAYNSDTFTPVMQMGENNTPLKIWVSI